MPRSYMARRILTGETIAQSLPFNSSRGPQHALTAADRLTGTLPARVALALAADGHPIFAKRGTELYALDELGAIEWGGIVDRVVREGQTVTIEASGFSSFLKGQTYEGLFEGIEVDPADVVRHLVEHVAEQRNGDLGIEVVGSTTVRIGTASDDVESSATAERDDAKGENEAAKAELKAARAVLTERRATLSTITKNAAAAVKAADGTDAKNAARAAGEAQKEPARNAVNAQIAVVEALADAQKKAKGTLDAAEADRKDAAAQAKEDGGAYRLQWWDRTDCGSEVQKLAGQTPFDYTERHEWDGESIRHLLTIHYPRAGVRRRDVALEQGVNVIEALVVVEDVEDSATSVTVIGAGEGAGALRFTASEPDWRARSNRVIEDPSITNPRRLEAVGRAALRAAQVEFRIESVTVRDHPQARIGSLNLGDDVPVTVVDKTGTRRDQWCRIVAMSEPTDSVAILSLEPAEQNTYGATA